MSLATGDVGHLFAVMQANYGDRWRHGADAVPVWHTKLRVHSLRDVLAAADRSGNHYPEWPPTLGEFQALVRESTPKLPSPGQEDAEAFDKTYAYCRPESSTNRDGNPHRITLPERIAARKHAEGPEEYRKRISDAMTFALYPKLGPDGRSIGDYT